MIDWPIGTPAERAVAIKSLPGKWVNSNPFLNKYRYGYHTGLDLNLNDPYWNADKDSPIYAIADGEIIFSSFGRGYTWGWIIIQHCAGFWVRYAHVRHDPFTINGIEVAVPKVGDIVLCGQQIARVGDAEDFYEPGGHHLHFDIARTDILVHDASNWPGLDWRAVQHHYFDPFFFISERKAIQGIPEIPKDGTPVTTQEMVTNTPNSVLRFREQPNSSADIITKLADKTRVTAYDLIDGSYRLAKVNGIYGFLAFEYLVPFV